MQNQIHLEEMDLVPLNKAEKQEIVGGVWPAWFVRAAYAVAGYITGRATDAVVDSAAQAAWEKWHPSVNGPNHHNTCDNV